MPTFLSKLKRDVAHRDQAACALALFMVKNPKAKVLVSYDWVRDAICYTFFPDNTTRFELFCNFLRVTAHYALGVLVAGAHVSIEDRTRGMFGSYVVISA